MRRGRGRGRGFGLSWSVSVLGRWAGYGWFKRLYLSDGACLGLDLAGIVGSYIFKASW